ncbi:MAG: hypothetical protein R6W90_00280 [Ignavibacteriaceae bacterium]
MSFLGIRHNYDTKKDDKPLIEILPESEINEFITYRTELEGKIKEKYGLPKFTGRLNLMKLREYLELIKACQCEGIVEYRNKRNRETLNFAKFKNKSEPSGEEAFSSIIVELMDKIKLPWVTRRFNIYDYPFQMDYREKEGKQYLAFKKDFDYQNKYSASYWLMIRES